MKKIGAALFLPLMLLAFFGAGLVTVVLTPTEVKAESCFYPECDEGGVLGCKVVPTCTSPEAQPWIYFHDPDDIDCEGPFVCNYSIGPECGCTQS